MTLRVHLLIEACAKEVAIEARSGLAVVVSAMWTQCQAFLSNMITWAMLI